MSTIELKIKQYEDEIRQAQEEIKRIENGEGKYSTWDEDKRDARIMIKEQSILSNKTLINTLLQQNLGKNNYKIIFT